MQGGEFGLLGVEQVSASGTASPDASSSALSSTIRPRSLCRTDVQELLVVQDRCRVYVDDLPRNLAALSNTAISIVRCQTDFPYVPVANRHFASVRAGSAGSDLQEPCLRGPRRARSTPQQALRCPSAARRASPPTVEPRSYPTPINKKWAWGNYAIENACNQILRVFRAAFRLTSQRFRNAAQKIGITQKRYDSNGS